MCAVVAAGYQRQWDASAALTAPPAWAWLAIGLFLTVVGFTRNRKRRSLLVLAAWLGFAAFYVPEVHSLARLAIPPRDEFFERERSAGRAVRVVSLNCSTGDRRTVREVIACGPDVVLLQESPSREVLEELAFDLFGGEGRVLWTADVSLVARGRLDLRGPDEPAHFMQATLEIPSGRQMEIVSLRLAPPVVDYALWSGECWTAHRRIREEHRREVAEVVLGLGEVPRDRSIIVGGDCNAGADDGAVRQLRSRLRDSFGVAGRGWGNTVLNHLPVSRFDQIWVSDDCDVVTCRSARSEHSDHRLVICDVVLPTRATRAESTTGPSRR
ncbi:MAG: hypothetical protein CMJ48_12325 [Planctomycetaceae bacterium]|nr:hypothetical protein [Planctomycetaceae bacterium]